MRRSASLISISTSSASGSTATVAAEVWMRPCASVSGTRCTRCTPLSNFSRPNTPSPVDRGDDLLVAADLALGDAVDLHLPAVQLGVALVHAEEVAGEQRRLVAAGAGAHLEDRRGVLVRVLRRQQQRHRRARAPAGGRSSARKLLAGELGHLGVVAFGHRLAVRRASARARSQRARPPRPPASARRAPWPSARSPRRPRPRPCAPRPRGSGRAPDRVGPWAVARRGL